MLFLKELRYKTKAKHSEFVKIFNCGSAPFEKKAREAETAYASIEVLP